MSSPIAYLNGRFLPFEEAALPLSDAGFVSGATVVDNARTFHRRLFRWSDHLARFRHDCEACFIPLEVRGDELASVASQLVEHNARLLPPGGELQLVAFATPGPLGFYRGEAGVGPATLGMVTYPLPFVRYRHLFEEGVTLAIAGIQHSNPDDLLPPCIKHRSRLHWHMADRIVNTRAFSTGSSNAVAAIVNQEGIGDTAIGCILAVIDGAVCLPVPGTVLESISAGVVAELCEKVGVPWRKSKVDFRELCAPGGPVSELFLAGTAFCLAGVRRVSNGTVSREFLWPGPVYTRLLAAWSQHINLDIAGQFIGNCEPSE